MPRARDAASAANISWAAIVDSPTVELWLALGEEGGDGVDVVASLGPRRAWAAASAASTVGERRLRRRRR